MDITPFIPQGKQVITGYGEGGFKINNAFIKGSLLVFPARSIAWDITSADALSLDSLHAVLESDMVELLLIGTGSSIAYIDPAIRAAFKAKNIGTDIMDTGAACRTYNVLVSEERRVAAALIAV
jgi:uncharacterized protein